MSARRTIAAHSRRLALIALLVTHSIVISASPVAAYEQQIAGQAQAIVEKLAGSEARILAVVDFTDLQGDVTELGRFLAEELSIGLADLGQGIEVVDRTHLKALLEEHKLSASGLIDPTTARELGRIAGVDALITGTVTPLGDSVRLAVKVLDTESAHIVTSTTTNIPRTQAIEELLRREIVSGGPDPGQPPGPNAPRPTKSVKEAGFLFQLRKCTQSGEALVCSLIVTNEQKDCTLKIVDSSRAIDSYGNQYSVSQLLLGNRSSHYWVEEILVRQVPMSAVLTFQGIAPDTPNLALLEVVGYADASCLGAGTSSQAFRVQLRNVPVSRK